MLFYTVALTDEKKRMGAITIVSGTLRGRKIQTPPGAATRPLLSRLRKSLVDILRPRLAGSRVLDLFGGSGAVAFECLSNGAASAVIVELNPQAAALIRDNARSLGLAAAVEVNTGDGVEAIAVLENRGDCFDLIMIAPPYGQGLQHRALERLTSSPVPATGGVVIVQRDAREPHAPAAGRLLRVSSRCYGRTVFDFYAQNLSEKA